jgi:hypothetical protein
VRAVTSSRGMTWGCIGMASFSLTLPMMRLAVADFDPVVVGLGRAIVAALLAAGVLVWAAVTPGERLTTLTLITAAFVMGAVMLARKAAVALPLPVPAPAAAEIS